MAPTESPTDPSGQTILNVSSRHSARNQTPGGPDAVVVV